jgi:hypothetical protein
VGGSTKRLAGTVPHRKGRGRAQADLDFAGDGFVSAFFDVSDFFPSDDVDVEESDFDDESDDVPDPESDEVPPDPDSPDPDAPDPDSPDPDSPDPDSPDADSESFFAAFTVDDDRLSVL